MARAGWGALRGGVGLGGKAGRLAACFWPACQTPVPPRAGMCANTRTLHAPSSPVAVLNTISMRGGRPKGCWGREARDGGA